MQTSRTSGQRGTLCKTFQQLAMRTWRDLRDSQDLGLLRGEETITDDLLLYLGKRHKSEVVIVQHNKSREKQTGTDWEWWLGAQASWFGMRIQAKRLDIPNLSYRGINRKRKGVYQVTRLMRSARQNSCFPAYVFYNYWDHKRFRSQWNCRSFPRNIELLGCTFAGASAVKSLMKSNTPLLNVDKIAWPWMCLVCCKGFSDPGAALSVRARDLVSQLPGDSDLIPDIAKKLPDYVLASLSKRYKATGEFPADPDLAGIVVVSEEVENRSSNG